MPGELPDLIADGLHRPGASIRLVDESPVDAGTGAATGAIALLTIEVSSATGVETIVLVHKHLRPATTGRHASGVSDPRHWAYWRREAEAYASDLLPTGPHLRAPRCVAVVGDHLYLERVRGPAPSVGRAASALASWQRPREPALDRPWVAEDQLLSRLAVTDLDWATVDADPRVIELWSRRGPLVERLMRLPRVLSHGDFSIGNLIDTGDSVVAIDWATLGWEPVGFDLGHLALSTGADPTAAYLGAAPNGLDPDSALDGFRLTIALVGASRIHWMLTRRIEPPEWYLDLVLTNGSPFLGPTTA